MGDTYPLCQARCNREQEANGRFQQKVHQPTIQSVRLMMELLIALDLFRSTTSQTYARDDSLE
jgi:hypothetical protein